MMPLLASVATCFQANPVPLLHPISGANISCERFTERGAVGAAGDRIQQDE